MILHLPWRFKSLSDMFHGKVLLTRGIRESPGVFSRFISLHCVSRLFPLGGYTLTHLVGDKGLAAVFYDLHICIAYKARPGYC